LILYASLVVYFLITFQDKKEIVEKPPSPEDIEYCKEGVRGNDCIRCQCNSAKDCKLVGNPYVMSECAENKAVSKRTSEKCLSEVRKMAIHATCIVPEGYKAPEYDLVCYNNTCGKVLIDGDNCQKIQELTFETAFSVTKSLCENCGGKWGLGIRNEGCNPTASDFGKVCNDNSECEGLCLAVPEDSPKAILGECSQYKFVFGCNREVINGKVQPELCRD
jgi:hypothetical protein